MASKKEVTVVINGEEYVSKAAKDAEKGLTGFSGFLAQMKDKLVPVIDVTRLAEMAVRAVSTAFNAAKQYVMDSIAAYDAYQASQTRLAAQSKLTGVPLSELNRLVREGKDAFGLSETVAANAASTIAKYASRAGDATRANTLLAAALDLGAASGLDAAATMEALEQGLRGQDEGFDKLLGKNPSALWKEYADANGLAVGKMTDTQKRMAELTAIVDAASKVQGTYSERLETGAGAQDRLNNRLAESQVEFGRAIQPARILVLEVLTGLVEWLGKAATAMGIVADRSIVVMVGSFKIAETAVGKLAAVLGKLTGNKEMQQWGAEHAKALDEFNEKTFKARVAALMLGQATEESATRQIAATKRVTVETEEQRKERLAAEKKFRKEVESEYEQLTKRIEKEFTDQREASIKSSTTTRDVFGKALTATMDTAADAIKRIRDALMDAGRKVPHEEFKRLDDQSRGYLNTLQLLNEAHRITSGLNHGLPKADAVRQLDDVIMKLQDQASLEWAITGNADEHRKRMELIADLQKKVRDLKSETAKEEEKGEKSSAEIQRTHEKLASNVAMVARGAMDAAQAFGVLDANAASSLNSAISISEALAKMAVGGLSFAGVTGVIGGVANIVSTMMQGDKERRELTRANTEALHKLRVEGVQLSTKATGQQIAGVAGALTPEALAQLSRMDNNDANRAVGNRLLVDLLAKSGLRLSDLDTVAGELGFNIRRENGQVALSQLPLLFQALQENLGQLTRVGQSFGDQYQFFKDSQRLSGASGITQASDLAAFLQNVGGARALGGIDFSDAAGARQSLFNLFTGLNNNTLSAADLGRLTGSEFRDAILELIGLLDNLETTTPLTTPAVTTTDDVVTSTDGVTLSVQSVQSVIEAMHTGVEGVLREHTGYQQRIAAATEEGLIHLTSIDAKMDTLILATAGRMDAVDVRLAALTRSAALERGRVPEIG